MTKNVEITTNQAGNVVDHIGVSLTVQEGVMMDAIDDPEADHGELIEEFEQTVHLRNLIIAKIGDTAPRVWECPVCAWLTSKTDKECEQCQTRNPEVP